MTSQERINQFPEYVQKLLSKAAKTDITKSRKGSGLYITDTIMGNIDLTYNAETKQYKLVYVDLIGLGGSVIEGKKSLVKTELMAAYDVNICD